MHSNSENREYLQPNTKTNLKRTFLSPSTGIYFGTNNIEKMLNSSSFFLSLAPQASLGLGLLHIIRLSGYTRVYPKVSGLAAWSENGKCYSSLPLGSVVSLSDGSV
jgi:hypothetical protein